MTFDPKEVRAMVDRLRRISLHLDMCECEEVLQAADSLTAALGEIERLTEALTLVERLYYLEDKDAGWRASWMNGVAREAQDGGDLGRYHRIFPRAALKGDDQ